jgi:hypothetical protein
MTQHAPSPDYSIVDWTVRFCAGCDDLCLTTAEDEKCEACQQYDKDDLAAKQRAAADNGMDDEAVRILLRNMRAGKPADEPSCFSRDGLPYQETWDRAALTLPDPYSDEAEILCDECGDVAQRYARHSDGVCSLEGKAGVCLGCGTVGKVYLREPDEDWTHASLRFRAYTDSELHLQGLESE